MPALNVPSSGKIFLEGNSQYGLTAYNDHPLIPVWLISNTLTWTPTNYHMTEKLVDAQEIFVAWVNELVGHGQADSKEKIVEAEWTALAKP